MGLSQENWDLNSGLKELISEKSDFKRKGRSFIGWKTTRKQDLEVCGRVLFRPNTSGIPENLGETGGLFVGKSRRNSQTLDISLKIVVWVVKLLGKQKI